MQQILDGVRVLWLVLLSLLLSLGALTPALAESQAHEPADLVYMNRHVYTMRASIGGVSPVDRVQRALQRIRELTSAQLQLPVDQVPVDWQGQPAVSLRVGTSVLLTVFEQDLDPEVGGELEAAAQATQKRLQDALNARREMSRTDVLVRGSASSLMAVLVCIGLSLGTLRLRRRITRPIEARITHEATQHRILGIDWSDYALGVVRWLLQLGSGVLIVSWCVFALGHIFRQFPATRPLADDMRAYIVQGGLHFADAVWRALPSIGSILMIVLVARGTVWALRRLFAGEIGRAHV